MKIKVGQASDRIVIEFENGRDIEIVFNAAEGEGFPSRCRISNNGQEVAAHESRPQKMDFWEIMLPGELK